MIYLDFHNHVISNSRSVESDIVVFWLNKAGPIIVDVHD